MERANADSGHYNILTIPNDALPKTDKGYTAVNSSLLQYSKKYNADLVTLNNAADDLVKSAHDINEQTAKFNTTLYSMYTDLEALTKFLDANPGYGI